MKTTKRVNVKFGGVILVLAVIFALGLFYLMRFVFFQPHDAASMFKKATVPDVIDISGNGKITANLGDTLNIPITMDFDGTYGLQDAGLKLDTTLGVSLFGNESNQMVSMYGESMTSEKNAMLYAKTDDDWYKSKVSDSDKVKIHDVQNSVLSLFSVLQNNKDLAKSATFTNDGGKNDKYTVTQKFSDIGKSKQVLKWFSTNLKAFDVKSVKESQFTDVMKNGKIVYTFDKYYNLRSIAIKDASYEAKGDMSALMGEGSEDTKIGISMELTLKFDEASDKSAYKVPSDVKKNAKESDTSDITDAITEK